MQTQSLLVGTLITLSFMASYQQNLLEKFSSFFLLLSYVLYDYVYIILYESLVDIKINPFQ